MKTNSEDRLIAEFDVLYTVLKRSDVTKSDAIRALRKTIRFIRKYGFDLDDECQELYGLLSLRNIVENGLYRFADQGGVATAEGMGKLLGGLSGSTVGVWRRRGKIIGYKERRAGCYLYPIYQVEDGKILNGIAQCIAYFREVGHVENWKSNALLLRSPLTSSSGACERAIDHLRNGAPEKAVQLLKTYYAR